MFRCLDCGNETDYIPIATETYDYNGYGGGTHSEEVEQCYVCGNGRFEKVDEQQ